jgi:cytochrome c oxidase subunit III
MGDASAAVVRRLEPAMRRGGRTVGARPKEPLVPPGAPPVSNARIAVITLLVAETMLFSGLIGAYIIFRVGSVAWPPPNLPRLPIVVTWLNTAVLLCSGATMIAALRAARRDDQRRLRSALTMTGMLGMVFLVVQGSEWARLVRHGLTMSTGMYGATFYTLIGAHAVHVVGAVIWLGIVLAWAWRGRFEGGRDGAVDACAIYWLFVCALWVVLFALVYQ